MSQRNRARTTNTTFARKEDVKAPKWLVFDAEGKTLGRFASELAKVLRGKHTPAFTPHVDLGDGVIVINAEKIVVTGNKEAQKVYRHYTGHMSGLREIPYRRMRDNHPDRIIRRAVQGMMPKTSLGRKQLTKLRIFKGPEYAAGLKAQNPVEVSL